MLKIGDTVRYNDTDWKVFEKVDETVYIIPTSPLGRLMLGGGIEYGEGDYLKAVKDYLTAVGQIEAECKKHTNAELGITEEDIRSLTVDDVNRIANYTPIRTTDRYAFYSSRVTLPETNPMYNEKTYEITRHSGESYNGMNISVRSPRFYTYDYAVHTAVDEQGYTYSYPEESDPVFVTDTSYSYYVNNRPHKDDNSIMVGSLFVDKLGYLASTCLRVFLQNGLFEIYAIGGRGLSPCLLFDTEGYIHNNEGGVLPLVSLNSEIKAEKQNRVWILSR